MRQYHQWTGRRDKNGVPLYVFEVAQLTAKRMSAYDKSTSSSQSSGSVPPKLMRVFALYENLIHFVLPLCSSIPDRKFAETPVSRSNHIVDISGLSLRQFWNLKSHMQNASRLATAHYPETLDHIFMIGAPSFFPTVWGWIKRWFDPITVSKIFILSRHDVTSTLEKYIDPSNIPVKYGGTLNWHYGTVPNLEPAISEALNWERPRKDSRPPKAFPPGPIRWKKGERGDIVAVAVGSENGRRRTEKVATLPIGGATVNVGQTSRSRPQTHPGRNHESSRRSVNSRAEEHDHAPSALHRGSKT